MKYLIVVDMQNEFVDGTLGTKEAEKIVPGVAEKIRYFDDKILYTKDTHENNYLETAEGKKLPVAHCIRGTKGWELVPEIQKLAEAAGNSEGANEIEKPTFGSVELGKLLARENEKEPIDSITLVGLCTDICVISNAMLIKAFLPETPIIVDASCCAGVTPESHRQALAAMKVCQIEVINEE